MSNTLAIDFGTSNSAVAILEGGTVRRLPMEPGSDTLPTAVFLPARGGAPRLGHAAAEALMAGEEGRYMRALKSVLGTPLLHESRRIGGRRRTLAEIVATFLAELRQRAEAATGRMHRRALSGRPVHFHVDPVRDSAAEADLLNCYHAAGFEEVTFLAEPEAAALACRDLSSADRTGLIVDIGGGTSDFAVFRQEGGQVRVLASHGIRLGGTDFDQSVSLSHAMPLLGYGSTLRREMGSGLLPVPNALFVDLASWAHIPFAYTPENRHLAQQMQRLATEPARLDRLAVLLQDELGHDLAFAVEKGKIAANDGQDARIAMGLLEPGLGAPITARSLEDALESHAAELGSAIACTLEKAGLHADRIDDVILVGGSSLMNLVTGLCTRILPRAQLRQSEAFTAVVDGLALARLHE